MSVITPGPKFIPIEVPYLINNRTTVKSESLDLQRAGWLVYADLSLSDSQAKAADLFVSLSLKSLTRNARITLMNGYVSTSEDDARGFGPHWQGRQPIDRNSQLITHHLNASGETQKLYLNLVIEYE